MSERLQFELSTPIYWEDRARGGYNNLGWVTADNLLNKMVEMAGLQGNELVVDAGTGGGAVLDILAPNLYRGGMIIGFDISIDMIRSRTNPLAENSRLLLGSIYEIPLLDDIADLVTMRQVLHNLSSVEEAIRETFRILRPGGRLIIAEYTPQDEEVLLAEKPVWDLKEPGRNLWTGERLANIVVESLAHELGEGLSLDYAILSQYSNRNWMRNSGLPKDIQDQILNIYLDFPPHIMERMGITVTQDGDTLVNRPWTYIVARKRV